LAKRDDVTSTERLLDLIRTDSKPEFATGTAGPDKSFRLRLKNLISNPVSLTKAVSVGVDLGHDDIKMVKVRRISSQKY
jgi:hypothetical protein